MNTVTVLGISSKRTAFMGEVMRFATAERDPYPCDLLGNTPMGKFNYANRDQRVHRLIGADGEPVFIVLEPALQDYLQVTIHKLADEMAYATTAELKNILLKKSGELADVRMRMRAFERASLWRRIIMAWKGRIGREA